MDGEFGMKGDKCILQNSCNSQYTSPCLGLIVLFVTFAFAIPWYVIVFDIPSSRSSRLRLSSSTELYSITTQLPEISSRYDAYRTEIHLQITSDKVFLRFDPQYD